MKTKPTVSTRPPRPSLVGRDMRLDLAGLKWCEEMEAYADALEQEIGTLLNRRGCMRDQKTTQFCAEAVDALTQRDAARREMLAQEQIANDMRKLWKEAERKLSMVYRPEIFTPHSIGIAAPVAANKDANHRKAP